MTRHPKTSGPRLIGMVGMACLSLATAGCAHFWDEALSNERDWSYATGWGKPDPLKVLSKGNDGVRRAQALGDLKEPLRNGGNAQDQDAILNILATAAKDDREPICRLAAIRNLGKFQDPRAARALEEVYQQPKLPFTADNNSLIRKEALVGLENTHDPESRHLLIRVARQPGPVTEANLTDRQQTQDEKLVAIRALGKYHEPECVEALKYVMKTEKDVALRNVALRSLEDSTNRRWPEKRDAWQNAEVQPLPGTAGDSFIQRAAWWVPKW